MISRRWLALAALGLSAGLAFAHGPTRQKVIEKITIDAPADVVWAQIKDFDSIAKWHPAVAKSPADKGNEIGSVRTIELKNGGKLVEVLEKYDAADKKYYYRAHDKGALPVTNYTSRISVEADPASASKSVVTWWGAFYRGYPKNDPPPDQTDEVAIKAVTDVYQAGLQNLKKLIEKK